MKEYLISVIIVSALISLSLAVSYKEDSGNGALKSALAVLMLYVTVIPLFTALREFDISNIKFDAEKYDFNNQNAVTEISEEGFIRGVRLFISDEFSLDYDEISVEVTEFDPLQLKAKKIIITLRGKAAHADYRAIREKLKKNGFENSEVKIES